MTIAQLTKQMKDEKACFETLQEIRHAIEHYWLGDRPAIETVEHIDGLLGILDEEINK